MSARRARRPPSCRRRATRPRTTQTVRVDPDPAGDLPATPAPQDRLGREAETRRHLTGGEQPVGHGPNQSLDQILGRGNSSAEYSAGHGRSEPGRAPSPGATPPGARSPVRSCCSGRRRGPPRSSVRARRSLLGSAEAPAAAVSCVRSSARPGAPRFFCCTVGARPSRGASGWCRCGRDPKVRGRRSR